MEAPVEAPVEAVEAPVEAPVEAVEAPVETLQRVYPEAAGYYRWMRQASIRMH